MVKNRKAHITEWLKNVLIVLLALSAIFLGWRTHLFDDLLSGVRTPELPTMSGGATQDYTEFVRPVNVAVVNENGRFAALYGIGGTAKAGRRRFPLRRGFTLTCWERFRWRFYRSGCPAGEAASPFRAQCAACA